MKKPVAMIAEGDAALRRKLSRLLCAEGVDVIDVSEQRDTLRTPPHVRPDLVIVGSCRGGAWASLDEAQRVRGWTRAIPIILITPESSEQLAIAALRAGLSDYFTPPIPFDELAASVRRWLPAAGAAPPRHEAASPAAAARPRMIGDGPRMREINAYIERLATTESTVLITGETGTGKELTAELIHGASRRQQRPLVCINCAAIPDSLLESELFGHERGAFTGAHVASAGKLKQADGGTVLFDEIGDMSPYAQAKILRLIESKEIERLGGGRSIPVDVRVIAATNQDLDRLMEEGRFRKDLYFRLNVVRIHLPALRERKEDLPALLDRYVQQFSRSLGREVLGFTEEAVAALLRHDWPGNVRELRNVVEAVFTTLRSRYISLTDLPVAYRHAPGDTREPFPDAERDRLLAALAVTRWNKSKAAERLHWSRMTVYRKMAKYHLVEVGHVAARQVASGGIATGDLSHPA
jgi:DNA-binding NtrC family response regulator